ncbi:hypothetical protein B1693_12160 [Geobacillus zalihae]|nr:hypothetical protein B1693_12160 [Geobacillus zalihae]
MDKADARPAVQVQAWVAFLFLGHIPKDVFRLRAILFSFHEKINKFMPAISTIKTDWLDL